MTAISNSSDTSANLPLIVSRFASATILSLNIGFSLTMSLLILTEITLSQDSVTFAPPFVFATSLPNPIILGLFELVISPKSKIRV